jgi:stearoyl-CoA desaturase (Delta-9 desaturase)
MIFIIVFFIAHWYLSLFSQTFFLHRYAAHKMFEMSKFWERFFYVFTWFTQGSSFLSPRAYAILHRLHHAHSDTAEDPHSPHYHNNIFKMMVNTKNIYNALLTNKRRVAPKFELNIPYWHKFEQIANSWISRWAWLIVYTAVYVLAFIFLDMHWAFFALLPVHYLMGPVHGAIVNWFGHKLGYANFDNKDKSKNSLPLDFLMLGELFQNNHHKRPANLNFAARWWEFDPVYPIVKILTWLRIIRPVASSQ